MGKWGVVDIDHGYNRIVREYGAAKGAHVDVGVLSNAGTYEGEGHANLADVATWNEFGTRTIPARPFMSQTFDKNISRVRAFIEERLSLIAQGKLNAKGALDQLGIYYVGKIQEVMTRDSFEPNAPSTIAAKGSSMPLIDTRRLIQSIKHEVKLR